MVSFDSPGAQQRLAGCKLQNLAIADARANRRRVGTLEERDAVEQPSEIWGQRT